jgi:hypothetical protein
LDSRPPTFVSSFDFHNLPSAFGLLPFDLRH